MELTPSLLGMAPACLSVRAVRRSGWQVFRSCFPAIGEELILLPPYNAGPVHHFRIPFQVIESTLLFLLLGPLFLVFHGKVIPLVNPQRGVHGHIPPTEMHAWCGSHGLMYLDDGGRQVADAGRIGPRIDKESCGPANIGGGRPSRTTSPDNARRCPRKWLPVGMSGSSPLSGVVVCVNSGVWSHLGITGTGKVSWSFQCWVPHSIIASTSTANFCAWSPECNDRHLTASWSGLRVRKIMAAHLLMYDWVFFT